MESEYAIPERDSFFEFGDTTEEGGYDVYTIKKGQKIDHSKVSLLIRGKSGLYQPFELHNNNTSDYTALKDLKLVALDSCKNIREIKKSVKKDTDDNENTRESKMKSVQCLNNYVHCGIFSRHVPKLGKRMNTPCIIRLMDGYQGYAFSRIKKQSIPMILLF